jgi:hypothetical protein
MATSPLKSEGKEVGKKDLGMSYVPINLTDILPVAIFVLAVAATMYMHVYSYRSKR